MVNNFLNINEISVKNLEAILEDATKIKKAQNARAVSKEHFSSCLNNTITGLLFEKLSTRTRLSFEAAVLKLGGKILNIRKDDDGKSCQKSAYAASFSIFRFFENRLLIKGLKSLCC